MFASSTSPRYAFLKPPYLMHKNPVCGGGNTPKAVIQCRLGHRQTPSPGRQIGNSRKLPLPADIVIKFSDLRLPERKVLRHSMTKTSNTNHVFFDSIRRERQFDMNRYCSTFLQIQFLFGLTITAQYISIATKSERPPIVTCSGITAQAAALAWDGSSVQKLGITFAGCELDGDHIATNIDSNRFFINTSFPPEASTT